MIKKFYVGLNGMTGKLKLPHPLVLIIGIGFLLYARSLSFDYTNFDDNSLIRDNQSYLRDLSNMGDAFKRTVFITGSDVFYRPIETIWLMLNARVGGEDLFFYHLSSLLLHFLAVYLVFILLKRLNNSEETSLFLSLIFLVHPLFAQAVAWVPGVVDVLALIFSVAAFLFFLDFVDTRQRKHFVLHLLFFALALYTKEISVGIMAVCVCYLHFIKKEDLVSYNKKVFLSGWIILFVLWFLMRNAALQGQKQKGIVEMALSIGNNLPAFLQYIGKALLPFNLSVMPIMGDTTFIYGAVVVLAIILALYFSKEKRNAWILFSAIWFLVFLLPTFIQTSAFRIHQAYEHRMYLPMVGFLLLFAETDWLKNFSTEKTIYRITAPAVLIFFFVLTFMHVKTFSDTKTFLDNAVNTAPGSSLAHRNMGIHHQDNNLLLEASEEYLKSLALNPHEADLHNNLGVIYDTWEKKDLAEQEYLTETRMNPAGSQAFHNLGVLFAARDENEKAEFYFKKALAVRQSRGTLEQMALLYKKTGRQEEMNKVIQVLQRMDNAASASGSIVSTPNPTLSSSDSPMPVNDPIALGRQLMQQGKLQEAEAVFKQVLMRDSMNTTALFNLGLIYYSSEQLDAAESLWRKAVRIDPAYTDAFNNLAISLARQGKNDEAEIVLKKLIFSNPNYMDGYFNIANFYARAGKDKEALFYVTELKKRGAAKEQFQQRGIKLSAELEKVFEKQ
ncbi:MAG: tetratricopeptide repeat protein [Bacteroidetes bacterium]|nr:MAG: tetratricopeptide repeat protein [Bacteroidota bacterium]